MLLLGSVSALAQEDPRAAIELYFKAHALGRGDMIRQAFVPEAAIAFVENGRLTRWSRDDFAARFRQPPNDEYRRVRRVQRLDFKDNAASAVLTLDDPQDRFTEHISLLKIRDRWKIVTDIFSVEHRNPGQELMRNSLPGWSVPFEPRRIIGNIYYVGTKAISSFLIVTPSGHFLLDTGFLEILPQVEANIRKLGFDPKDVKFLLNSQAHFDHCGGFAEFKRKTGADVIASKLDGQLMARGGKGDFFWGDDLPYEPVSPDRSVADGERVELGGTSLTAHITPGHTKGCTTWSMRVQDDGQDYDVVFLCGLTLSLYKLTNSSEYPNLVSDVHSTFSRLRAMHADVLLGAHGSYFDFESKAARQGTGGANPFIDSGELQRHVTRMAQEFQQALDAQERQR